MYIPVVSAGDIYNITYPHYTQEYRYFAGENVITPHYHFNDEYFSLYNDGSVRYMIYQKDYIGKVVNAENNTYQNAFVGVIEPDQCIMLTTNACYLVYSDYNDIRDIGDPDVVINKIQSWWYVIIYLLLIIVTVFGVWKVIRR